MGERVLHAIVGHKLGTYFLNSVRSVRSCAPDDDLLVVDNASEDVTLRAALMRIEAESPQVRLIQRRVNEQANLKVGGLYGAYREVVEFAITGEYDLLHIIQADMQMLWWGPDAVQDAVRLFEAHPDVVNIHTTALPRARRHSANVVVANHGGPLVELANYGLTDTGLYHLGRWRERGMSFDESEQAHACRYSRAGLRVLCHPLPPVCQIPWPAVVRAGAVRGREIRPVFEFLLRPLDEAERAELRLRQEPVWLEDIAVPWGWLSLTPAWPSAVESIDPFVDWYRDIRRSGRAGRPRWDRRGIVSGQRRAQRRPALRDLIFDPIGTWLRRRDIVRVGRRSRR